MLNAARFLDAQRTIYSCALAEISAGAKRSHWMWYIFPQIAGLGRSEMAQRYALASLSEAREYLVHPVLGQRLRDCVDALQDLPPTTTIKVFGQTDSQKLQSSLTLFVEAGAGRPFEAALERWFNGELDTATLQILRASLAA